MYKKIKRQDVPKREHRHESLFESTTEWKRLKADIDRGLKKDESCLLKFTPADWKGMGLSGTPMEGRKVASGCYAVARFIKKYLAANHKRYTVRAQHQDGFDCVIVDG